MSSTYFIKVRAKSKKQEVDTFIQKLLDSEKFDEFADKIAMKAVERINDNKEAEKQLRSAFEPIDGTHRSAASKKKKGKNEKSSLNLTSDDEKTTVISLKYKRFTQNILEDYAMNEDTNNNIMTTVQNNYETNSAKSDEGFAKSAKKHTKKTKLKIKTNSNDNKTVRTKKTTTKRMKNYDASTADKVATVKDSEDDVSEEFTNENKSLKNEHLPGDDEDNNNVSKKVAKVELQKTDDEDESDFVKKGNNEKSTDSDVNLHHHEDVNDDMVSREQEQNEESSAGGSHTQQSYKNKRTKTNKKHRVDRANNDADVVIDKQDSRGSKDDKSGDKYQNDDENKVLKDNGNADAEEDKEKQSTEERLKNNKILVRREGNTLYAQNLEEYEEYRDQLAAGAKNIQ